MSRRLRVLLVEDSDDDAQLLIRALRKGGYDLEFLRVETEGDMRTALAQGGWQLVISDYAIPGFGGPAALHLVQDLGLDLPFILVSGTVGEDQVVECLHAGAEDFLVKGKLARLIPAIERALRLRQERASRAMAEAHSAAKTAFVSSISHELRTPLNAILGYAQLLHRDRREPLSARHKERVDQILRAGEHVLRLIDDTLDLSRIESGAIAIAIEAVDVVEAMEELRETLEPMASKAGIALGFETEGSIGRAAADRVRFSQILMNLGSNAIKYNRPGGQVTFRVSSLVADRIRVTVHDTGTGIPADKQSKIFEPYQRAGQETGSIQGTGIGLVISQRLARLMGGEVGFTSVWGQGSDFWVEVPVHPSSGLSSTPSPRHGSGRPTAPREGRRLVLGIDDSPTGALLMGDLIDTLGTVDLITAPTVESAAELALSRRPDVIILDLDPGSIGAAALARIASGIGNTPVIGLCTMVRDRARGIPSGVRHLVAKPLNVDELVALLERLLQLSSP